MTNIGQAKAGVKAFKNSVRFTLAADRGWKQRVGLAYRDIQDGVKLYQLAWALAFSDIKLRYRGSAIGPFWLTISTGVQIGSMAFIYADLFHTDIHTYFPFLCVSMIFWGFLSSLVTDGCTSFIGAEGLIKGTRMPFFIHAMRSVLRDAITFCHNLVVVIIVLVALQVHQSFAVLWVIPGLLLWFVNGFALALALGAICARFRDIPQIVGAVMQIAFFVTPIMWMPDILKGHRGAELLVHLNPFVYMINIVRNPLINEPLTMVQVERALAVSAVVVIMSMLVFARTRGRIAFWV